jgi:hypothetical protein
LTLDEILDRCAEHFQTKYPDMDFVVIGRHDGEIMHSNTKMSADEILLLCNAAILTEVFERKRYVEYPNVDIQQSKS